MFASRSDRRRPRSPESIRHHYEVERELADRLRAAPASARPRLYGQLYDELFRRVPDHPQLARKAADRARERDQRIALALAQLDRLLGPTTRFLEIGAGDCSVSFAVAARVAHVVAVDVSEVVSRQAARPANFELLLTDGTSIAVPAGSIDLAYSNQLMEHLHPDDALAQLRNLYAALAPGGAYLCVTPHRFSGPHDVSRYFDDEATGFHLKEYTHGELAALLREVGFSRVEALAGVRGRWSRIPLALPLAVETGLARLAPATRRRLAASAPLRPFVGMQVLATK